MLLLDLKHSGKPCEDLTIRGSNDGSNGNDTEAVYLNYTYYINILEDVQTPYIRGGDRSAPGRALGRGRSCRA